MRNFIVLYFVFFTSIINAQETKAKLIEVLNPLLLSNDYKVLNRELKSTYKDLANEDTIKLEFTFDSSWRLQDFISNKSGNFDNIKAYIEHKDWAFDNSHGLSDEMKDRFELITLRKCTIKLFKKGSSINIVSNIRKVKIDMYDARNFYFIKGIKLQSENPVKPLNSWYFNNYLQDSLRLNIDDVKKYMHIDKVNTIKFTVPERLFKFNTKVYLRLNIENRILELSEKQNYIFLPKDISVDFLAIDCNTGNMIVRYIDIREDLIINDKYTVSNYYKLNEMISRW